MKVRGDFSQSFLRSPRFPSDLGAHILKFKKINETIDPCVCVLPFPLLLDIIAWFLAFLQHLNRLNICLSFSNRRQRLCKRVCFSSASPTDEFVQHEGLDAALVRLRGLWAAAGGCGRVHRLLAADGGGHRPAAEPDHRGQDGAARRPLEGLLRGRWANVS